MKRINIIYAVLIALFIATMLINTSCEQYANIGNNSEEPMKSYYTLDDFQSIVIGESTFQDVYDIAPPISLTTTSYGGFCEYPSADGKYIHIKFYGAEMIVGAIELK